MSKANMYKPGKFQVKVLLFRDKKYEFLEKKSFFMKKSLSLQPF